MKQPAGDNAESSQAAPPLPILDRILFYVLLAILATRPLIGESFERIEIGFITAMSGTGGTTPATTAWLDTLLLAAAGLTLARHGRWCRSRLTLLGLTLLVAAVVVSTVAGGNKHLALFAGANLFVTASAGAALLSLIRAPWMRHVILAAVLATGCTTALKCVNQEYYELPETERYWEQTQRPQLLAQGFDPDDPLFVNYERRLLAQEPHGFLAHPNITASCLMMWLLVLAGGLAGSLASLRSGPRAQRLAALAAAVGCALLAGALWLTGSLGALAAGFAGLIVLLFLGYTARWSARHARLVVTLFVIGYVAAIGAVAAYGLTKGTLPHPSLEFRWYYWTAAGESYLDAPLTGIGRENFAAAYMRYKPAVSTEEVRNPHNLWLSLLVELGPLGLAGGALLCVLCLRATLRRLPPTTAEDPTSDRMRLAHFLPLVAGVALVHAIFSGTPFRVAGMTIIWTFDILLPYVVSGAAAIVLLPAAAARRGTGSWLAAGVGAALVAALVHGLLSFAPLTPGGLSALVLVVALAGGYGWSATVTRACDARHLRVRWLPLVISAAALLSYVVLITWPTTAAQQARRSLDQALRAAPGPVPQRVIQCADRLALANPRDPAAARVAAGALRRLGQSPRLAAPTRIALLENAVQHADEAVNRDRHGSNAWALLAALHDELAGAYERDAEARRGWRERETALECWEQAIERYPTNPRTLIAAGDSWYGIWQRDPTYAVGPSRPADVARRCFERALEIDRVRDPADAARLRAPELELIRERLDALASAATSRPTRIP